MYTQEQLIDFANFMLSDPICNDRLQKKTVTSADFYAWLEITHFKAGIMEAKERIEGFMFMHGMKEIDASTLKKLFLQVAESDPTPQIPDEIDDPAAIINKCKPI